MGCKFSLNSDDFRNAIVGLILVHPVDATVFSSSSPIWHSVVDLEGSASFFAKDDGDFPASLRAGIQLKIDENPPPVQKCSGKKYPCATTC